MGDPFYNTYVIGCELLTTFVMVEYGHYSQSSPLEHSF